MASPDGNVTVEVPPDALDQETSIFITDSGQGINFEIVTDIGGGPALFQVAINPEGTVFNVPVTITLAWPDADDDGIVDETGPPIDELDLQIVKDGVVITSECRDEPLCDPVANRFSVQVTSLSDFTLFALGCPERPAPVGPGYWHRQCKGWGTPRFRPTEELFSEQLVPCADSRLAALGFAATATCDGVSAEPAKDPCERATRKLTTLILTQRVLGTPRQRLSGGCGRRRLFGSDCRPAHQRGRHHDPRRAVQGGRRLRQRLRVTSVPGGARRRV